MFIWILNTPLQLFMNKATPLNNLEKTPKETYMRVSGFSKVAGYNPQSFVKYFFSDVLHKTCDGLFLLGEQGE